jgi:hypothetical protein
VTAPQARPNRRPRLQGESVDIRLVGALVAVALALSVAIDVALGASRPGLIAAIGFFGCVGMILGAKWLGKALLARPESYWAETDQPEVRDDA